MSIRLYHPQHGYHVLSYGDDEAVFERHGWSREEQKQPAPPVTEQPAEDAPKRRGRKPKAQ